MNLYLFRKYWSKHKGRLFSLILSIILLSASFVFSVLNERSDQRRFLNEFYDFDGTDFATACNITDEMEQQIAELKRIENTGKIMTVGKVDVSGTEFTIGYHADKNAEKMNHLPLEKGRLPEQNGEIAMPKFILEQLSPLSGIGDDIELTIKSGEETVTRTFTICGVIRNKLQRSNMEYISSDGSSVKFWGNNDYPIPSLYIYRNELPEYTLYTDLMLRIHDKYFVKSDEPVYFLDVVRQICPDLVGSQQQNVMWYFFGARSPEKQSELAQSSNNTKAIRIISYMIMLASVISMLTGVISIMPDRIESLRLLRSIGMSKRSLVSLFVTEFFMFWMIGTAAGVGIACGAHEIMIFLQRTAGIAAYRGYIAEYAVQQSCLSPFLMPIIFSFVIAVVSMIVPVDKIMTMSFCKSSKRRKAKRPVRSFTKAYGKMTGSRLMAAMTIVSVTIVMFTTAFGYSYYTKSGKGTSYMAKSIPVMYKTEDYVVDNINLKEAGYDCVVTAGLLKGDEMAIYDKKCGFDSKVSDKLSEKAHIAAWGNYPTLCVLYPEGNPLPETLKNHISPFDERWEYYEQFKSNTILDLHMILLNEEMMDEIGGFTADDVVCISGNLNIPYEVGDTVPLFTCLSTNGGKVRLDTIKYMETQITGTVSAIDFDREKNYLLDHIYIPAGTPQCFIAMTVEKAEELGFYYPAYSHILMRSDELSDTEMKSYAQSVIDTGSVITTMSELKKSAILRKLSDTANYVVLFIILFILNIVSTWNLLRMNVSNNLEKFSIMHSIGMPISRLRRTFIAGVMKYTAAALAVGTALSYGGKFFLKFKFEQFYALTAKQQILDGNDSFPRVSFGVDLPFVEKGSELFNITKKLNHIKEFYLLEREMWLPNLVPPLAIAAGIILLATFLLALSVSRKIKDERSNNDDRC